MGSAGPTPQRPDPDEPATAPSIIEVGATEDGLRYWVAKEALRQGETRLNAQNGVRTALEARATAITGWAAVGFLATVGAGFSHGEAPIVLGSAVAGVCLFVAGALGIVAARPRGWSIVGYEPEPVLAMAGRLGSELEVVESLGFGVADGIRINNGRIGAMSRLLRRAGWLLIVAPLIGGGTCVTVSDLCGRPAMAAWVERVAACRPAPSAVAFWAGSGAEVGAP